MDEFEDIKTHATVLIRVVFIYQLKFTILETEIVVWAALGDGLELLARASP